MPWKILLQCKRLILVRPGDQPWLHRPTIPLSAYNENRGTTYGLDVVERDNEDGRGALSIDQESQVAVGTGSSHLEDEIGTGTARTDIDDSGRTIRFDDELV